jgi:succinate dehydrogenase flavoprotein subunit
LHEDLKDKMQTLVGIIRTEEDLKKGLGEIERLKEAAARVKVDGNRHFNAAWHQAVDVRNMLVVSEAMARAALLRKESRGAHARDDFREMDKGHFSKVNIVVHGSPTGMQVGEAPLGELPPEIQQVLKEET